MEQPDKTILIVDDEAPIRKLLRKYLEDYTVLEAADGAVALQLFRRHRPDVVLSDIVMPELDGLSLLKIIRDESPDTPVLMLSGAGSSEDIIATLRLGAHNYLEKPLHNKEVIVHAVHKAFDFIRLEKIRADYQINLERAVAEKTIKLQQELEARAETERQLVKSQKEWVRTFDAIPDLIAIIDPDFNIVKANKAMLDVIGTSELESGSSCFLKLHNDAEIPSFCPHAQLLRDGKKHTVEIYEERLGGYYEITAVPYYGEDGVTLMGSVHIARNIDDRKAMESEREGMQISLLHTQKLESVGQLAAGIAHEINTPIQFVSSNTDFLEESFKEIEKLVADYEQLLQGIEKDQAIENLAEKVVHIRQKADWEYLAEEIPKAIRQNREGLKRVASIVMAMKEFSHPGSEEKESRNLNDIIKTTGVVTRNEWKYVAKLEMNLDENLPPVMCYSDDIGQVFLNIIVNAAHAIEDKLGSNPDGVKGTIQVTSKATAGHVEVSIRDSGTGIPEKGLQKIFDPFYTTKKVGKGTGQGLAIAWNIITQKHGGELRVKTKEGIGTTFIMRIPTV